MKALKVNKFGRTYRTGTQAAHSTNRSTNQIAGKGYGSIDREAKPNGLLTRGP